MCSAVWSAVHIFVVIVFLKLFCEMNQSSNSAMSDVEQPLPNDVTPSVTLSVAPSLNVEMFITDIFERPALWNGSGGNKDVIWNELSRKYKWPVESLKRKWSNLRRSFRNELKKIPRNLQNVYLVNPHMMQSGWPYYRSMLFLVDQIHLTGVTGIVSVKTEDFPSSSSNNFAKNKGQFDSVGTASNEFGSIKTEDLPPSTSTSTNFTTNKRRFESFDENDETTANAKKQRSEHIIENQQKSSIYIEKDLNMFDESPCESLVDEVEVVPDMLPSSQSDSDQLFLMSLCHYMKKVDPARKMYIRTQIQMFLYRELYPDF